MNYDTLGLIQGYVGALILAVTMFLKREEVNPLLIRLGFIVSALMMVILGLREIYKNG